MKTLLREAAEWRLIGLLFECPRDDWQTQLDALAAEVADADLKSAVAAAREQASESLYHSTFGPGGPAAPREVSHRETILPGTLLSELHTYYRAFAYQPATKEAPDHVSVMAGFIGYLRLKQAYAESRGDSEQAAVAGEAAQHIIAEHLNPLGEPLAKSLAASGITYLAQAAAALLRRVGPVRKAAEVTAPALACPVEGGCAFAGDVE